MLVSHTGLMSGAERVLVRLAEAATRRGFQVRAAVPTGPLTRALQPSVEELIELPELKLPSGPRAAAAGVLALRTVAAARRLRTASADIVLANGLLALPALRLARLRAPVAWLVHDLLHRRDQLLVLRLARGVVSLGVAVSEAVGRPLLEQGLDVVVVRNGTPWPPAPGVTAPASPPVVGCAALLTPWKGQDVLLEAMARLGRPEVHLELAGGMFPKDSPYVARLRSRAAAPDLTGRVHLLGQVDDVMERMRRWTVAVIASVDPEAAPLVLLEAMSAGVPVVGTDIGGTPEVIGEAGLLVPPGDPDALSQAIATLLDDRDLRRRCAEAGPRAIAASLTIERWEGEIMGTLKGLVSGGGPASTARRHR
jgi:glycosyltransferase involved in cell wall biosynthesis